MSNLTLNITPATIARFWAKVDCTAGPDACWPWIAAHKAAGYGNFFVCRDDSGRQIFVNAHKLAYILTHGSIADGELVRHTCDYKPCCNPAHLINGSRADNVQDAIERGLWNPSVAAREAQSATTARNVARRVLTEYDIALAIVARAEGWSLVSIAQSYGISDSSLRGIARDRTYRDIPLAQQWAALRRQGIDFPYYRGHTTPATLPAALLELTDAAARLVRLHDETQQHRELAAAARARQADEPIVCQQPDNLCELHNPCPEHAAQAAAYLQQEARLNRTIAAARATARLNDLFA